MKTQRLQDGVHNVRTERWTTYKEPLPDFTFTYFIDNLKNVNKLLIQCYENNKNTV